MGEAAIKTAKAATNTAGAAATLFGTGFYADLKLKAEIIETNLASLITAGNSITILADKDIIQKGFITIVKIGDITYNSGQNIPHPLFFHLIMY